MTEFDLDRYFRVAVRWLWLIALSTALAAGVSYRATKMMPSVYRTQTTLMVGADPTDASATMENLGISERLAAGYALMVKQPSILDSTVKALRLPFDWHVLGSQVLVSHQDQTQDFTIYVTDTNSVRSKEIADELVRQIIQQSPTERNLRQVEQRRQFVQQQMDELQKNITQAENDIATQQAKLAKTNSARDFMDQQDEIKSLQDKITIWRSTYANLVNAAQATPPTSLRVIYPADVPSSPVSPSVRSNALFAGAAGFLVALMAVLGIEYFNDTISSTEDLSRAIEVPVIGHIANMGRCPRPSDALVALKDAGSPIAEAYRFLRTTLKFANIPGGSVPLLVTSPVSGEGKSVTSANLAVSFALAGKRVILVDADLRNPTLHTLFGTKREPGLGALIRELGGSATDCFLPQVIQGNGLTLGIESFLRETEVPGLRLLLDGPTSAVTSPPELLGSTAMQRVVESLLTLADVVILDTPPVLPVADTVVLAGSIPEAAVMLVIEVGGTRYEDARLAVQSVQSSGGKLLGIVANKASNGGPARYHAKYPAKAARSKRVFGIFG